MRPSCDVIRRLLATLLAACAAASVAPAASAQRSAAREPPTLAAVVSREEAVVVTVRALGIPGFGGFDENAWKDPPPPDPFSGYPEAETVGPPTPQTMSSGFVVDADGWVLTNAHAVVGATRLRVRLADGRELAARIAGVDVRTDVALLRVDGGRLVAARVGDIGSLVVGDWVFAIGAPFGLHSSVTAGIVSAWPRYLPGGAGVPLIQTDVAVNPGSSGSPLFNLRGEVVGINSMVMSGSGGYEGVSLALPIDVAMQVATELRKHGHVRRGHLGAQLQELTTELARSFGLDDAAGAVVLSVDRGGPADRAGLRTGDVVLGVAGTRDRRYVALQQTVAATTPQTPIRLDVWRRGSAFVATVVPAELEPDAATPADARTRPGPRLGLALEELSDARRAVLRLQGGGVQVRIAEGAARDAGVRGGDIILAINDVTVANVAGFDAALAAVRASGRPVALLVQRGAALGYLAVDPGD
jgi:serine protease Do